MPVLEAVVLLNNSPFLRACCSCCCQKFEVNWTCVLHPACLSESVGLLWIPRSAEFLIWKVKPGPGNHSCFFGAWLFHKLAGGAKPARAVAISQPECHNLFQGWLLLIEFPPEVLHLVAPCCTLHLASQPVLRGCTLHSRPADRPAGNSLLPPLLARAGSRLLDKVRGGARGESNPPIILTWLPTTPPYPSPCSTSSTPVLYPPPCPSYPNTLSRPRQTSIPHVFQTHFSPSPLTPHNLTPNQESFDLGDCSADMFL